MLYSLHIQNLAVVENASVTFQKGLTVITGESGAGKSLLIRALALALGARADKDDCGSFSSTTVIETEFALAPHLLSILSKLDVTIDSADSDDTRVTLRRELTANGRSRCFVNDQLIRLSDLADISTALCEISGQSSSIALRDSMRQLALLDDYAGLSKDVATLGALYDNWMAVRADLRKLEKNREALKVERELLQFQQSELESAELSLEEEDNLSAEKKRLDDFERLSQTCDLILSTLENDGSPLESLQALRGAFAEVNAIDERFSEQHELFDSSLIQLEEVRRSVATFSSALQFDAERLEELNQRLSDIYQLKNKYGGTVANAIEELGRIRQRLNDLPDPALAITGLQSNESKACKAYTKLALKIRETRKKAAASLAKVTRKEFSHLALEKAQIEFVLEEEHGSPELEIIDGDKQLTLKAQRHGLENGSFFFSANPGESPRPLARVASGGELSRVLLALKIATRKSAAKKSLSPNAPSAPSALVAPVAVFDEIDTGVSGATATAMGKKLKELSTQNQTIVVTHLRQVVEQADNHLLVEKTPTKGKNHVSIRPLDKSESGREQMKMVDLETVG